jgi:ABC-type transporter Mla maintaining outer membrane lipid asymmetry permease subunit MlaE
MVPGPDAPPSLRLEVIVRCERCGQMSVEPRWLTRIIGGALLTAFGLFALGAVAVGLWLLGSMVMAGAVDGFSLLTAMVLIAAGGAAAHKSARPLWRLALPDRPLPLRKDGTLNILSGEL